MTSLSLVIPAFNEEARLPALRRTLESAPAVVTEAGMDLLEALIVDDGSSDGTKEALAEVGGESSLLRPLTPYRENRGKGAAVAAGVKEARGDYVLIADVDFSTPLEELGKLVAAIRRGADVAIGSRAVEGAEVDRGPAHRKLSGRVFNGTVRVMTGLELHDTQCGFKLLPTPLAKVLLANQICPGFAYDVELLLRADRAGMKIVEVPVTYIHDDRSRVNVASASLEMLKDVCTLSYRIRMRREGSLASLPAFEPIRERTSTHG